MPGPWIAPPWQRLRRRLSGTPASLPRPEPGRVIEPGRTRLAPPAVALPDELGRVRGVQEATTFEHELLRVRGGRVEDGATTLWRVGPARLAGGTVYAAGGYVPLTPGGRPWWSREPAAELDRALLCSSPAIEQYFGHWVTEGPPSEVLAVEQGCAPLAPVPAAERTHEPGYRELFQLEDPKLSNARVRELWVSDDFHMNAGRTARLARLCERARANAAARGPGAERVFLLRLGRGSRRRLVNEEELAAAFQSDGGVVVDPESLAAPELVAMLRTARVVVGVEGSALGHGVVAAPPGAAIVALEPPRRFNNIYKDYADVLDLTYAFTVGDEVGDDAFRIPADRFARLLELVDGHAARGGR